MEKVKFSYNGNFLVAEIKDEETIFTNQMSTILHNQIKYLIPAKKQIKNDMTCLNYDITSKLSLQKVLPKGSKMKIGQFLTLAAGLIQASLEVDEYASLVNAGILMDVEYIFVDAVSFEPNFIYVPIYRENKSAEEIKGFIKDLFMSNLVDMSESSTVQSLLEILNMNFNVMKDFEKAVMGLKNKLPETRQNAPHGQRPAQVSVTPAFSDQELVRREPKEPVPVRPAEKKEQPPQEQQSGSVKIPQKPGGGVGKAQKEKQEAKEIIPTKVGGKVDPVFIVILVTIFMLAGAGALINMGLFSDESGHVDLPSLIVVPILIAAVDYFLLKKLPKKGAAPQKENKEKPVNNKKEPKENKPLRKNKKSIVIPGQAAGAEGSTPQYSGSSYEREKEHEDIISVHKPAAPDTIHMPMPMQAASHQDYSSDKTELIMEGGEIFNPYIEKLAGMDAGKRIYLKNNRLRIGKMQGRVDYVLDNAKISKMHADIIAENGSLFIVDLGSTNGVFINGSKSRIDVNTEYPLKNNDRFMLANEEFSVHM